MAEKSHQSNMIIEDCSEPSPVQKPSPFASQTNAGSEIHNAIYQTPKKCRKKQLLTNMSYRHSCHVPHDIIQDKSSGLQ